MEFKTIVFTHPEPTAGESEKIMALLDAGVDFVHIRKPNATAGQTALLLRYIKDEYHPRLRIHDHIELLDEFTRLAGFHLNSRCRDTYGREIATTTSCHSIAELSDADRHDYVTLSPIYDSISKPGYRSDLDLDSIEPAITRHRVVALGGVTPDKFSELHRKGFFGAALLGYIWEGDFDSRFRRLCDAMADLRENQQTSSIY